MQSKQYLKEVKEQYENYPYPQRDPKEETDRLVMMGSNNLNIINHYCFKGMMPLYPKNSEYTFRILVAGAGTGDAVIDFAEQFRELNATVTYLDMSSASMAIAKERAEIRKFSNIEWIHDSLLELPQMQLEKFDYINCIGVLHHLDSPIEGLNALKSVLKPNGAMGIMLYALYGRMPIYQMQDLARRINREEENLQTKIDNTKEILNLLPDRNWYKVSEKRWEFETSSDIGLFDLLLHSQDRAYSIPQLYEYIEEQGGLKIIEFMGNQNRSKLAYHPASYLPKGKLLQQIEKQPKSEQQAIAELLGGDFIKHIFAISNEGIKSIANIENIELVPYFTTDTLVDFIVKNTQQYDNQTIKITVKGKGYLEFKLSVQFLDMVKLIDGERSLKEIFSLLKGEELELLEVFRPRYESFFKFDLMLLKSKEFPTLLKKEALQERFLNHYYEAETFPSFQL